MSILSRIPGFQRGENSRPRSPASDREDHKGRKAYLQGHAGGRILKFFHSPHENIDFSSLTQSPIETVLQKYLGKGEYPNFRSVAMFESSFFQVTKRGRQIFMHNQCNEAIIGIASTNIKLPLPTLMFIARPVIAGQVSSEDTEEPMLTRLIPLRYVRISIHDPEKRIIKIKLINGRTYYLRFHATNEEEEPVFDRWLSLVYLLQHPPPCYLKPQPKSYAVLENLSIRVFPSDDEAEVCPLPEEPEEEEVEEEKEKDKEEAAKSPVESRILFEEEEYSTEEREAIEAEGRFHYSLRDLYVRAESYEIYESVPTVPKTTKLFSSESFSPGSLSSSSSARATKNPRSPPRVFPVPKKEGSSSLNIVTLYSIVSKTAERQEAGKRKN
ncbi:uncharacterized protein LOC128411471 isoform X1 [Podarcis raffonei]|uniref:uncharacterized protein LOC128411471 isoform X1 n=2 Tax=Podarcis raffonei TaxID=65483 RepID=UPI0023296EC1|nr:uncharacterized protein LOC128411471 isoform X1 [Podarcis raffonei]